MQVSFQDDAGKAEGPLTGDVCPSSGTITANTTNTAPVFTEGKDQILTFLEHTGDETVQIAGNIGSAITATDADAGDTLK